MHEHWRWHCETTVGDMRAMAVKRFHGESFSGMLKAQLADLLWRYELDWWKKAGRYPHRSSRDVTYEAGDIIGERVLNGQTQYHTQWLGLGPDENSWEPAESFAGGADSVLAEWKLMQSLGDIFAAVVKLQLEDSPTTNPVAYLDRLQQRLNAVPSLDHFQEELKAAIDVAKERLPAVPVPEAPRFPAASQPPTKYQIEHAKKAIAKKFAKAVLAYKRQLNTAIDDFMATTTGILEGHAALAAIQRGIEAVMERAKQPALPASESRISGGRVQKSKRTSHNTRRRLRGRGNRSGDAGETALDASNNPTCSAGNGRSIPRAASGSPSTPIAGQSSAAVDGIDGGRQLATEDLVAETPTNNTPIDAEAMHSTDQASRNENAEDALLDPVEGNGADESHHDENAGEDAMHEGGVAQVNPVEENGANESHHDENASDALLDPVEGNGVDESHHDGNTEDVLIDAVMATGVVNNEEGNNEMRDDAVMATGVVNDEANNSDMDIDDSETESVPQVVITDVVQSNAPDIVRTVDAGEDCFICSLSGEYKPAVYTYPTCTGQNGVELHTMGFCFPCLEKWIVPNNERTTIPTSVGEGRREQIVDSEVPVSIYGGSCPTCRRHLPMPDDPAIIARINANAGERNHQRLEAELRSRVTWRQMQGRPISPQDRAAMELVESGQSTFETLLATLKQAVPAGNAMPGATPESSTAIIEVIEIHTDDEIDNAMVHSLEGEINTTLSTEQMPVNEMNGPVFPPSTTEGGAPAGNGRSIPRAASGSPSTPIAGQSSAAVDGIDGGRQLATEDLVAESHTQPADLPVHITTLYSGPPLDRVPAITMADILSLVTLEASAKLLTLGRDYVAQMEANLEAGRTAFADREEWIREEQSSIPRYTGNEEEDEEWREHARQLRTDQTDLVIRRGGLAKIVADAHRRQQWASHSVYNWLLAKLNEKRGVPNDPKEMRHFTSMTTWMVDYRTYASNLLLGRSVRTSSGTRLTIDRLSTARVNKSVSWSNPNGSRSRKTLLDYYAEKQRSVDPYGPVACSRHYNYALDDLTFD